MFATVAIDAIQREGVIYFRVSLKKIRKGGEFRGIPEKGATFRGRPLFEKGADFGATPFRGIFGGNKRGVDSRQGHPNPKLDLGLRGPYLKVGQHHHPGSYGESKAMQ